MSRSAAVYCAALGLLALGRPAAAQTSVEYGAGAANSSTGTAGAFKGLSDTINGVLGSLDKSLNPSAAPATTAATPAPAAKPAPATPSRTPTRRKTAARPAAVAATPVAPPPPPPVYEDPHKIVAGIAYDELLRRFGPPTIEFTNGPSSKMMSYVRKDGVVQVHCLDGKVAPPKAE